jgi:glycosyltransferase involved in cell wall biosynthesis
MDVTYVLPIRCSPAPHPHDELVASLRALAEAGVEIVVVDNSDHDAFAEHERVFGPLGTHVEPALRTANGKVANVLTGLERASHDAVVLADDDVRHDVVTVRELARRLEDADAVVPANVFEPMPWHARWDTGRTLLNRSFWIDYPGTLAVRRSTVLAAGGYDGDVLFENLELLRTIRANGGRVRDAPDVLVPRRPPSTSAFLGQRVRQAYDDLAQPVKLVAMLTVAPLVALAAVRHAWRALAVGVAGVIALGELGRRRDGGASVFPSTAALWSPLWLAERAICVWIALARRVAFGGVRYGGSRLRRAATPMRELRRRAQSPVTALVVDREGAAA